MKENKTENLEDIIYDVETSAIRNGIKTVKSEEKQETNCACFRNEQTYTILDSEFNLKLNFKTEGLRVRSNGNNFHSRYADIKIIGVVKGEKFYAECCYGTYAETNGRTGDPCINSSAKSSWIPSQDSSIEFLKKVRQTLKEYFE